MVEAYVDCWPSGNVRETLPVSVDEAGLSDALLSLDGKRSTEISLSAGDKSLLIGGQGGRYFVQYLLDEDRGAWVLVGSNDSSGETELAIGRQSASYPSRQIVGKDQALSAAVTFVRTGGERDTDLAWDRDY